MPSEEPAEPASLPDPEGPDRPYEGCYGCGRANPHGLKLRFEAMGDEVQTTFTPDETHQGYPGLLHGGILSSLLDETMGYAAAAQQAWVMTGRIDIRYLAPAPIGRPIRAIARVTRRRGRAFSIEGEARLVDGPAIARASGLFMQVPDDLLRRVQSPKSKVQSPEPSA